MLLLALWGVAPVHAQSANDAAFLSTLGELREATYADKAAIVERLSQSGHPSVRAVLTALLEDRLYFRNSDQKVFIVKSAEGDPLDLDRSAVTCKDAGSAPADSLTKIGTNNGLRRTLRTTVAHFALSSPDAAVRLDAVRDMLRSLDDATVALLRERSRRGNEFRRQEGNRHRPGAGGARRPGRQERVSRLSPRSKNSVSQDVRNRLALLLEKSPDGSFAESDETCGAPRPRAVADHRPVGAAFYSGHRDTVFWPEPGSVLVLIAIGLAITFGVMGVINMAHGELMMLGAYTTYAGAAGDARITSASRSWSRFRRRLSSPG